MICYRYTHSQENDMKRLFSLAIGLPFGPNSNHHMDTKKDLFQSLALCPFIISIP